MCYYGSVIISNQVCFDIISPFGGGTGVRACALLLWMRRFMGAVMV
nr:MAG TPA: hypothetical protein [Caudoviricetes sp.]